MILPLANLAGKLYQSYFRAMEFKSIRIVLVVLGECEVDKEGRTEIEDRNVRLLLYY